MFGKFVLQIDLGNAEMSEPHHIAEALRKVADQVDAGHGNGRVRDVNGNTVGEWEVKVDAA